MAVYHAAPHFTAPAPPHTLTKAAKRARRAVAAYAQRQLQQRRDAVAPQPAAPPPPQVAGARIAEVAELSGSARAFALTAIDKHYRVAVTIYGSGGVTVWALADDGMRMRAMWHDGRTGGVVVTPAGDSSRLLGITAAKALL